MLVIYKLVGGLGYEKRGGPVADGTGRGRGEGPEVVFGQLDVRHLFNIPVWQSGGPLEIVGEIEMTERMIICLPICLSFSLFCAPAGCDVMPCFYNPVIICVRPSNKVRQLSYKNRTRPFFVPTASS